MRRLGGMDWGGRAGNVLDQAVGKSVSRQMGWEKVMKGKERVEGVTRPEPVSLFVPVCVPRASGTVGVTQSPREHPGPSPV